MDNTPRIYLGGPIHGLTQDQANGWRQQAAHLLAPEFGVLDPMENKVIIGTDYSHYTDEELVVKDLLSIQRARAVLRYTPGPTHGSDMETFFASHNHGIPVVTWGPGQGDRSKLSLWLRRFTVKNFETLEEAVAYLKGYWTYPGDGLASVPVIDHQNLDLFRPVHRLAA